MLKKNYIVEYVRWVGLGISQFLFGNYALFILTTEHCIGRFKLQIHVRQCNDIITMERLIVVE